MLKYITLTIYLIGLYFFLIFNVGTYLRQAFPNSDNRWPQVWTANKAGVPTFVSQESFNVDLASAYDSSSEPTFLLMFNGLMETTNSLSANWTALSKDFNGANFAKLNRFEHCTNRWGKTFDTGIYNDYPMLYMLQDSKWYAPTDVWGNSLSMRLGWITDTIYLERQQQVVDYEKNVKKYERKVKKAHKEAEEDGVTLSDEELSYYIPYELRKAVEDGDPRQGFPQGWDADSDPTGFLKKMIKEAKDTSTDKITFQDPFSFSKAKYITGDLPPAASQSDIDTAQIYYERAPIIFALQKIKMFFIPIGFFVNMILWLAGMTSPEAIKPVRKPEAKETKKDK